MSATGCERRDEVPWLPQAKSAERAPRMGTHLTRVDMSGVLERKFALELPLRRGFVSARKTDEPEQEMQA